MKHFTLILGTAFVCCTMTVFGQGFSFRAMAPDPPSAQLAEAQKEAEIAFSFSAPDDQDDPAYAIYKEGKKLIYAERWDEARKKFALIIFKYPKSGYTDDAAYWSAFALKHTDRKKAIEAYRKFVKDYSHSSYYDDAVADLSELKGTSGKGLNDLMVEGNARVYVTDEGITMPEGVQPMRVSPHGGIVIGDGPDSLYVGSKGITVYSDGKSFAYKYGFAPRARALERALRLSSHRLNRLSINRWKPFAVPAPGSDDEEKLDPETRLKMEALYAIGETKEDEKSFQTLKEVALDFKQPEQLREAALDALSEFKKFDVIPVYVEIAKRDTNEDMQAAAIDFIGEHGRDKNVTVNTLIDLYNVLPSTRSGQREMVFYSIADVGNDRAVDFLTKVAKSKTDYELRQQAIYYLGCIGGEKARTALYEILQGKGSQR